MIDRWMAAGRRPGARLEGRPARVTALGVFLRGLRRARGHSIASMAERLGAQDLGLSPEALSAIERGDSAPPPGFETWVAAGFALSPAERAALSEAMFLAADPFRAARAGAEELALEEALQELAAPVDPLAEDGVEAAKALLRARRTLASTSAPETSTLAPETEPAPSSATAAAPARLASLERRP